MSTDQKDSKIPVKISLFILSYIPLFLIIIIRQVAKNNEEYVFTFSSFDNVLTFFSIYKVSLFLIFISFLGLWGTSTFIDNVLTNIETNGSEIVLKDIKNKNSESISYIATYIIPFLFQDFNSYIDLTSMLILFAVILSIYVNSSIMLINPLLNCKYYLFEIDFVYKDDETQKKCNGMIIIKDKNIDDENIVKIDKLSNKLYFAIKIQT